MAKELNEKEKAIVEKYKYKQGYPNSFLFAIANGFLLNFFSRSLLQDQLLTRPFSYPLYMLVGGFVFAYWDFFRRNALEKVLENEEKRMSFFISKSINNLRVGEEKETTNLVMMLSEETTQL